MGNVTSRSLQLDINTTLTWSYTYNSFGQVLTATDPLGNTTTNTYDTNGNLLTTTTPSPDGTEPGFTTTFAYNSLGQLVSVTDPRNNTTTFTYTPAGLLASVTDALNNTTTYTYDARGNRTSVTDALNNTTAFTYNVMNRLTQITYHDQSTTSFTYDNRGRRTSVTDANNRTTTYAYDDADRLISVTDAASATYGYETENNLTSITDALSRVTSFAYDALGRVTSTTFPSTLQETYTYDAVGNLLSKTDRKNQTIDFIYDALNRLTRKEYPDASGVDYTYDNAGRLVAVEDSTGTYEFTYDNLGRLVGTSTTYSFLPSRTFTIAYSYDETGNRISMLDPEKGTTDYVYDALYRLTSLTNFQSQQFAFSYDALSRLVSLSNFQSQIFTFSYDQLSRRTQLTRPNGVNTNYSYDNLSRLLSVLHQLGGNTIDGASYSVDAVGNRTSKTNHLNSETSNYSYDQIYQLTQVVIGGNTTENYSYDGVGNRLSSLGVSPYTYTSSNQLTSTPSTTFTYDDNGNTVSKVDSAGTTSYAWDYENQLSQVTLPAGGGTIEFKYDPLGRRIQKSSASVTTIYLYDGENIVEEVDGAGTVVARYTHGLGLDEPLAQVRSGTTHFYTGDALGSITSLTDSNGSVGATYTYDSFGNQTASTGTVANPFRYTAREFDSEIALHFYRARYYAANLGRFASEDPVELLAPDSQSNLFMYVVNNPTNWADPLGLYKLRKDAAEPSPAMDKLLKCIDGCYGSEITVTSTSEESRPYNPVHARGEAADIKYPSDPKKLLCCAAKCGVGFGLDEKLHPTKNTTGPNIHIQIPRGRKGGRGDLPRQKPCACAEN